jgi:hypothetical protein
MISLPTSPRRSSADSQKYQCPIIGVLATKRTKATIAAPGYDALDIVVSNVVLFELVKSFRALRKFFPRPRES